MSERTVGYVVLFRDTKGNLQMGGEELLTRKEAHGAAEEWSTNMPWPEVVARVIPVATYEKGKRTDDGRAKTFREAPDDHA